VVEGVVVEEDMVPDQCQNARTNQTEPSEQE
jgi:hypothetical protein